MRVHVVQIITMLELGGAQEVTLYIAEHLDPEKYEVTLISGEAGLLTPEARASLGENYIEVPEMVREISPLRDAQAFWKLYRIIGDIVRGADGPVIVHTHSSKAGILGRLAGRLAGAKVIVHSVHGWGFNEYQGTLKRAVLTLAEKLAAACTDGMAADSYKNIEKGKAAGVLGKAQVEVIRSGIDTGMPSPVPDVPVRQSVGVPEDAPFVLMVSCLKPQKAPVDFVRVAAKVSGAVPDAQFVLVGDGELRDEVEAEAERLGLNGRFHLPGWRRDVRELINACDVLALTSLWEGLPRVVLMAMAAGKPVVATAVDGTPEAVKDGVSGFLARPHAVGYMAEKTGLLLRDKALAMKMGDAGRAMVSEFDEVEMLRRIEALYERLLKEAA